LKAFTTDGCGNAALGYLTNKEGLGMMQTSEPGRAVVRSFEGCALRAYKCPANVWTIGYGNTNHDACAVARIGKIGPRGTTAMCGKAGRSGRI
jgi:lysozyme